MDALRKLHNDKKRQLIIEHVPRDSYVLDCGCGRGGDLQKWKAVNAYVVGYDPCREYIEEARDRVRLMRMSHSVKLHVGDIHTVKGGSLFDVICYNFSIQYIVDSLASSAEKIARHMRPHGKLIGITPDSDCVKTFVSPDALGNTVEQVDDTHIKVYLTDGPFYADGPKVEPVINRAMLEQALSPYFTLVSWKPMLDTPNGLISDIYSSFVFLRN
jgi:ubiquinone/menaquinone biosynthesis C-methylase UbiE